MTYLMYAVNPEAMRNRPILEGSNLLAAEEGTLEKLQGKSRRPNESMTNSREPSTVASMTQQENGNEAVAAEEQDTWEGVYVANPWVPVVKCVLEFARQRLWMPEVRRECCINCI